MEFIQVHPRSKTFRPSKTGFAIMQLVHGYFSRTRKPWTLMRQDWILEKLEEWYGLKVARSTLNYNLRILREHGLIETVKRHKLDAAGQLVFQPTLYKMTKALKRYFYRLAEYFKRCAWTPSLKALKAGYLAAVGDATTRAEACVAYHRLKAKRSEKRRGAG